MTKVLEACEVQPGWQCCKTCGVKRNALYRLRAEDQWQCRVCLGLVYQSSRLSNRKHTPLMKLDDDTLAQLGTLDALAVLLKRELKLRRRANRKDFS